MLLKVYASKDNLLFEHKCTSSHSCSLQMGTTVKVQSWYNQLLQLVSNYEDTGFCAANAPHYLDLPQSP